MKKLLMKITGDDRIPHLFIKSTALILNSYCIHIQESQSLSVVQVAPQSLNVNPHSSMIYGDFYISC